MSSFEWVILVLAILFGPVGTMIFAIRFIYTMAHYPPNIQELLVKNMTSSPIRILICLIGWIISIVHLLRWIF